MSKGYSAESALWKMTCKQYYTVHYAQDSFYHSRRKGEHLLESDISKQLTTERSIEIHAIPVRAIFTPNAESIHGKTTTTTTTLPYVLTSHQNPPPQKMKLSRDDEPEPPRRTKKNEKNNPQNRKIDNDTGGRITNHDASRHTSTLPARAAPQSILPSLYSTKIRFPYLSRQYRMASHTLMDECFRFRSTLVSVMKWCRPQEHVFMYMTVSRALSARHEASP